MSANLKVLKYSLLTGALYFFSVSVVHMLGIKVPMLFIYFNVPSYAYQDRIISFLAFGWSVFLFTAFTDPQKNSALVKTILVAGAGALIGVSVINATADFQSLDPAIHPTVFWLEAAGLFVYWLWLVVFHFRSGK